MSDYHIPLVILSHRKRAFIKETVDSLRRHMSGPIPVLVLDDSGDPEHCDWVQDEIGLWCEPVSAQGNVGYLEAMQQVWRAAREGCENYDSPYALLWEEDFVLTRDITLSRMITVMDKNPDLAQLNFQRQSVYGVEKRFGYMDSHQRRGYGLRREATDTVRWVSRRTPFTTNPSLIRREALEIAWPSREECDAVQGGAEPAMSLRMEQAGFKFGWYGPWDTPVTRHIGDDRKSGIGY